MTYNNQENIQKLIDEYGEEKTEKLLKYIDFILEKNQHINLTAVKDRDEAIEKHIIDSLTITELKEYKEAKDIIDIGTGAGFPGALLAIVSPEKNFCLVDSLQKRLRIIGEAAELLDINNITLSHIRAEEHRNDQEYKNKFNLCVSRAVANLNLLSKLGLPFVKKGGCLIAYKGENVSRETSEAESQIKKLGAKIDRIVSFENLPESISGHNLVIIKKER